MIPEGFHFLRPVWLFALGPVALLVALALRADRGANAWKRLVDAHLLRHLVDDEPGRARRWPLGALALGWVATTFALAGPAWERLPQAVGHSHTPAVVVLSLARSMDLGDVTPSRLERARFELAGIAERSRGGQLGLIVYTDVPFVAVPLTDDARVVEELIPLLRTDLMPAPGRHLERAIDEATSLIEGAGGAPGRIVVLADGADDRSAALDAAERARQRGHRVSVVGLGTATSSDVPLDADLLAAVAAAGGGRFADAGRPTALASVLHEMNPEAASLDTSATTAGGADDLKGLDTTDVGDAWRDAGIWLLWVPLLLAPLCFRRGWLAGLVFLVTTSGADPAAAEPTFWSDLWQTRDQQGARALSAGKAGDAAELFENPDWQATARYQSGDYEKAAQGWQERGDEDSRYNRGNALARGGKLEEAIAAWGDVIEKNPTHADARFNRDLVQKLLDQQKKQEQGGDGESQDSPQAKDGKGGEPGSKDKDGPSPDDAQAAGSDPTSQDGADPNAKPESDGSEQAKANAKDTGAGAAEEAEDDKSSPGEGAPREDQPADLAPEQTAADKAGDADEKQDRDSLARNDTGAPEESAEERARRASEHDARTAEEQAAAQKDHALGDAIDESLRHGEKSEGKALPQAQTPAPIDEAGQRREQRLRQIPTDPSGLLRARIHRHYAERQAMLSGGFAR